MQDLKLYLDAVDPRLFHTLLAVAIGSLYYGWRKLHAASFDALPQALKALPGLLIGAGASALATNSTVLSDVVMQIVSGVGSALLAVGGHHVLKESALPYQGN